MPKMKTHKATAKRFRVKKSKKGTKVLKRTDGQDHFNSRESGKVKRNKR
ncbi:50S ribosomal protein L35, partial [Candidatus Parcubacteria bacterium]